jgi:2-oxo-4-hydroxy-4-carboxy-5-ureidoimidazoline decarboxylase
MAQFTIAEVNAMAPAAFVEAFGDVAEHSSWVAEAAARGRPFASRETMVAAFVAAIQSAGNERKLSLLLAHPDLAGRAAIAGNLTEDSRREQAGAGLDRLTPKEFARFNELNSAYRERHGIPFILAVRGATKHDIIEACEVRMPKDPDAEFETAIAQVCRIVRFRLEDRVREGS